MGVFCTAPAPAQDYYDNSQETLEPLSGDFLKPPEIAIPEAEQGENIMDKVSRLPPDIQDMLMAESHKAYKACADDIKINRFHDCECYALEFLRARYEQPGDLNEIGWLKSVNYRTCLSKPKIAGHYYTRCVEFNANKGIAPDLLEEMCACVARVSAEEFDKIRFLYTINVNNLYHQSLKRCADYMATRQIPLTGNP